MMRVQSVHVNDQMLYALHDIVAAHESVLILCNDDVDTFILVGPDNGHSHDQARVMVDALRVAGLDD